MYLSKIKYQKGDQSKVIMVLILGRKDEKLVCLLDDKLDKKDAELIKRNSGKLKEYTITNKISWIKYNMPHVYKNGYREIYLKNVRLLESFPIK